MKRQIECSNCWAFQLAQRVTTDATRDIQHIRQHYPELAQTTLDAVVESIAQDKREQNTPIKYELFRSIVRRQVSSDFLIDASLDCPGLTEYRIMGVPFHTACGMPPERIEELKHAQ